MLRCPEEECRQSMYVKIDDRILPIMDNYPEADDNKELTCPVCGAANRAIDWKSCWNDPQPFTFLEKFQICRCGGEFMPNVRPITASMGSGTGILDRLPVECDACKGKPGSLPGLTLEELKQIRGYNE